MFHPGVRNSTSPMSTCLSKDEAIRVSHWDLHWRRQAHHHHALNPINLRHCKCGITKWRAKMDGKINTIHPGFKSCGVPGMLQIKQSLYQLGRSIQVLLDHHHLGKMGNIPKTPPRRDQSIYARQCRLSRRSRDRPHSRTGCLRLIYNKTTHWKRN